MNGAAIRGMASGERQVRVDIVLDRFFSLSKQAAAALGGRAPQFWGSVEASAAGQGR